LKWITESIAVGGLEDVLNPDALASNGIAGVLSIDWFPAVPPSKDLLWRKRTLLDGPGNDTQHLTEALAHLQYLVENCPRVLVHCREGMSRSPFVVACHIATTEQRDLNEVLAAILAENVIAVDPALLDLWAEFSAP
jgi:protein-tyrosine phosphatase